MRIVIALGGNALLHRGEALSAENQRTNVKIAAAALAPLALEHQLVITHGNGPQVGLLALQYSAHKEGVHYPLDILDAESEGMIGYLVEQELSNLLPAGHRCATLLTQTEVDPNDPAFQNPTKPIGPVYDRTDEMGVIELLVERQVTVICAGGGGIPVVRRKDGQIIGVEAVIDKDFASALLARELGADALVMLTDVEAVYQGWGEADARALRRVSAGELRQLKFVPGSMGPKVAAACEFVEQAGGLAGIGQLKDASALLSGEAGTLITQDASDTLWWD
jgi:carbamate kinase